MANVNSSIHLCGSQNTQTVTPIHLPQSDRCTTRSLPCSLNQHPPLCTDGPLLYSSSCCGRVMTGSLPLSVLSSQRVNHAGMRSEFAGRCTSTTTVHGFVPRESSLLVSAPQVSVRPAPPCNPLGPDEVSLSQLNPCGSFASSLSTSSSLIDSRTPSTIYSAPTTQRLPSCTPQQASAATSTCTESPVTFETHGLNFKAQHIQRSVHANCTDIMQCSNQPELPVFAAIRTDIMATTTTTTTSTTNATISASAICDNMTSFTANPTTILPKVEQQRQQQQKDAKSTEPADADHVLAQNALPHWNMRWTNVLRYPKYNTRKNSGFERRLKHTGLILDPKLTLRLLRKLLQPFINNAVNKVLQHYMEEYISLAVRNIRDNLGENAVTEKDLERFRRSVMQRVAMQYFCKEDVSSHEMTDSNLCGRNCSDAALPVTNPHRIKNHNHDDAVHRNVTLQPSLRLRNRKPGDPDASLHRRIVQHNWGARYDNGLLSSSCTPSTGLSPAVSDGLDGSAISLLDGTPPAPDPTHVDKISLHEESLTRSASAVSSPASSDHRLGLTSVPLLKVPSVVLQDALGNTTGSVPVSSRSTSPHTPSSASSCSTLGYFFNTLSNSDDDEDDLIYRNQVDRSDDTRLLNHHRTEADACSLDQNAIPETHDRRRPRRAARRIASWWNWSSTRRSRSKRPRHERPPVNTTDALNKTSPANGGLSWRNERSRSKSTRLNHDDNSVPTNDAISNSVTNTHGAVNTNNPRFVLNEQTVFTLGSSANTWLGMGAARGRIYTKHPELFRYQCDSEDKAWLVRNGFLASHGVKAYLMHSDQIRHIGRLNGRVISSGTDGTQSDDLQTFTVPLWLVKKVIVMASNHPDFYTESMEKSSTHYVPPIDPEARPAFVDHMAPFSQSGDGEGLLSSLVVGLDMKLTRPASNDNHALVNVPDPEHTTPPDRPQSSSTDSSSQRPSLSQNNQIANLSTPPSSIVHGSNGDSWLTDDRLLRPDKATVDVLQDLGHRNTVTCANISTANAITTTTFPVNSSASNFHRSATTSSATSAVQRSARIAHTTTAFEYRPDTKSPGSPPTLKPFDYT